MSTDGPTRDEHRRDFANPPREFGMIPFWFWNDTLEDEVILEQIRAFHAAGFGGFSPQARIGLSREIGYLTPEFFRLVRLATEEAARLGMTVVLYDEGSYPSGSAQGRVVAENFDFAARCLFPVTRRITGPAQGYWRPNPGRALRDRLIGVVLGQEVGPGAVDPATLRPLEIVEPGIVRYDLPAGDWVLTAVWHAFSGGTIRGVFPEEEDDHVEAPAAADLLNSEAVAAFMRHTHERYYQALAEFFGSTVMAMFTDEPSTLGRGARRRPDPWPYTPGFLAEIDARWGEASIRWLPALWLDCGDRGEEFRRCYTRAVYDRLDRTFYAAQSEWCVDHGIALTGHPTDSGEFGVLRRFQWPGQDMVWRWVEPGTASALEGEHSTAPKCAASAAIIHGRARCATELFGAYGWQLTMDEAKWLLDWHLVRGVNLFYPHACFYSVRGRRAFESEPDIGIHNVWWPYFGLLADYTRRLSWLLSTAEPVCRVAVLTDPNAAAWAAAAQLYRSQVDFLYIGPEQLDTAAVDGEALIIGGQRIELVVADFRRDDGAGQPVPLTPAQRTKLGAWEANGGRYLEPWTPATLTEALARDVFRDLVWPHAPDIRLARYRLGQDEIYLLVNEGESAVEGALTLAGRGGLQRWDPMTGEMRDWPATVVDGRLHTRLRLERRQAMVLVVDQTAPHGKVSEIAPEPLRPGAAIAEMGDDWRVQRPDGQAVDLTAPGDWAAARAWETYSGTLCYSRTFDLTAEMADAPLFLDLGEVGDIAAVIVNDQHVGVSAWAPHHHPVGPFCRAGANRLEIRVTNSMANYYDGACRPSGLMGPVLLRGVTDNVNWARSRAGSTE